VPTLSELTEFLERYRRRCRVFNLDLGLQLDEQEKRGPGGVHASVVNNETGRAYGKEQKDRQAKTAEKENIETSPEIGHSFRANQPAFRTGHQAPDWTICGRGGTATYEKVTLARQLLRL